jgi:hypothetical protein
MSLWRKGNGMRKSWLRVFVGAGITAALVAFTGTAAFAYPGATSSANVSTDGTRTSQVVVGVGSDTTYEVMQSLDQLYNRSPGCALINTASKLNTGNIASNAFFDQRCVDGGQLTYSLTYSGLLTSENLYHDAITEEFPVGSGNGKDIQTNFLSGTPAGPSFTASGAGVGFGRSSSNNGASFVAGTYTVYGTAFAREGIGFWVGKNNTNVASSVGVPTPDLSKTELHDIWIGTTGGTCLTTWSSNATDSTTGAYANVSGISSYGASAIVPYATQSGSGTGKTFSQLIGGTAASDLQNCLPTAFKAGMPTDHVIFENNAKPICTSGSNFSSQAIFPYSFGRFTQNKGGTGTDADNGLCAGTLGGVNLSSEVPGSVTVAGIVPSIPADSKVVPTVGAYPLGRYVYAYWPWLNGTTATLNDPTTWGAQPEQVQAAAAYLHPTLGWICNNGTHNAGSGQNAQHTLPHGVDPVTGKSYAGAAGEIAATMKANGFSPLPSKVTDTGGTFTGTSLCRFGV